MSLGFFDWAPESIGTPFVRMAVTVEINFAKLSAPMRKKLRKAVETGVLESYGGKMAAIYRTAAVHYGWNKPHLWTRSGWAGCRFYVTEIDFNQHIAPFLAVLAEGEQTPIYVKDTHWGHYGTLGKKVKRRSGEYYSQYHREGMTGKVTPNAVVDKLVELDQRNPDDVAELLEAIDNRSTIRFNRLIPNS